MNATTHYLEALKTKISVNHAQVSDYRLAKELGVSRQQMSKYRNRGEQFSDETCLKVASILELDPILVMTEIQMNKAKTDEVKATWKALLERLGGVAAMLLITTGVTALQPAPVQASELLTISDNYTLCEVMDG